MCSCSSDKVCNVCAGRLSVYRFMVDEWEKSNPRPKGINIEEHYNWACARDHALQQHKMRVGIK